MEDSPRKNVLKRIATFIVALPILLALFFLAPNSAWYAVCAGALGRAAWELTALTHKVDDRRGRAIGVLFALAGYILFLGTRFGTRYGALLGILSIGFVMLVLLVMLTRPSHMIRLFSEICGYLLCVFYLGGMLAALALVRDFGTPTQGGWIALLTLSFAWASDALAMGAGKLFGGPKLCPAVSPNKTWAGAIGGLIGSVLSLLLVRLALPQLPFWPGVILAVLASIFGQAGDLCESALKRCGGVKDSGSFLPGHGGMLDRLDAVTFAAFIMFVALQSGLLPFHPR